MERVKAMDKKNPEEVPNKDNRLIEEAEAYAPYIADVTKEFMLELIHKAFMNSTKTESFEESIKVVNQLIERYDDFKKMNEKSFKFKREHFKGLDLDKSRKKKIEKIINTNSFEAFQEYIHKVNFFEVKIFLDNVENERKKEAEALEPKKDNFLVPIFRQDTGLKHYLDIIEKSVEKSKDEKDDKKDNEKVKNALDNINEAMNVYIVLDKSEVPGGYDYRQGNMFIIRKYISEFMKKLDLKKKENSILITNDMIFNDIYEIFLQESTLFIDKKDLLQNPNHAETKDFNKLNDDIAFLKGSYFKSFSKYEKEATNYAFLESGRGTDKAIEIKSPYIAMVLARGCCASLERQTFLEETKTNVKEQLTKSQIIMIDRNTHLKEAFISNEKISKSLVGRTARDVIEQITNIISLNANVSPIAIRIGTILNNLYYFQEYYESYGSGKRRFFFNLHNQIIKYLSNKDYTDLLELYPNLYISDYKLRRDIDKNIRGLDKCERKPTPKTYENYVYYIHKGRKRK